MDDIFGEGDHHETENGNEDAFPSAGICADAGMIIGLGPVFESTAQADINGVPYLERSWDSGSKSVMTTQKTADCAVIDSDTETLNGWYIVTGSVKNDNRIEINRDGQYHPIGSGIGLSVTATTRTSDPCT